MARLDLQKKLPIMLSGVAVITLVVLAVLKLRHWQGGMLFYGVVLATLYLLWLVLEARVAAGEVSRGRTTRDRGTLELYALARFATAILAVALPTRWQAFGSWVYVGLGLFVGGVALRLWAIRTLGAYYSHRVRWSSGQRIVKHGPFAVIRHPAYTGMLVAHLGLVLFFFNWVALVVLLVGFVPAVIARILVEEKLLFRASGYSQYARRRKRLLPFIW